MREKRVECPKCRKAMAAGFLLGYRKHASHRFTKWVEGEPKESVWTGISIAKRQAIMDVTTYRCTSCGFLESYARS